MKLVLAKPRGFRPARRLKDGGNRVPVPIALQNERKEALFRAIERAQGYMHKRTPTDAFMRDLRAHFPSPAYFIESNRFVLERAGFSWLDAFYYALIPPLTRTCMSQQWGLHPRLDRLGLMGEYLKTLYVGVHVECFYVILLNRLGKLIRPVLLQKGGVDNAPFYLRQLMTVALQEEARYIVLAHNHPGGTRRPSNEDLRCTLRALEALAPMQIPLLDHIIIAGRHVVSIRDAGLLPAMLWRAARPTSRIVKNWLEPDLNNS